MSLTGWNEDKKFKYTGDSAVIDADLTDFPFLINIGSAVGKTNFDDTAIFDELIGGNDEFTKLLISSDDTDGSTIFTDSSPSGRTVSIEGDVHHEVDQAKFGNSAIQFNGTTSALYVANNTDLNVAGIDWTVDFWIHPTSNNHTHVVSRTQAVAPNAGWYFARNADSYITFTSNNNTTLLTSTDTAPINSWTHVAATHSNGVLYLFINGVLQGSTTVSIQDYATDLYIGRLNAGFSGYYFDGYIDEFNFSTGIPRWTANFTPPTKKYTSNKQIAVEVGDTGVQCYCEIERWDSANKTAQIHVKVPSVLAATDPVLHLYYDSAHAENDYIDADNYTKLLISSDDTDGSTIFTDSSPSGHTVTVGGNVHHETDQAKFGKSAVYFSGVAGDKITIADSADFAFGADDFTIDWWEYRTTSSDYTALFGTDNIDGYYGVILGYPQSGQYDVYMTSSGTSWDIANGKSFGAITTNQWVHYAVVRSGNTFYLFKNGIQVDTWTSSLAIKDDDALLHIGERLAYNYQGYIDEFRISKGIARWTANFTTPSIPYRTGYIGDTGSYQAQNVWDANFVAVYHMSQDPSIGGACILDSTGNTNHGTPNGSMTSGDLVDGLVGKALDLDGVDDWISIANGLVSAFPYTLEAVARQKTTTANWALISFADSTRSDKQGGLSMVTNGGSGSDDVATVWNYNLNYYGVGGTTLLNTSDFFYLTATFTGDTNKSIFTNGADKQTLATNSSFVTPNIFGIGRTVDSTPGDTGNIVVGEVRISNISRSDAWIKATNYSLHDDFFTVSMVAVGLPSWNPNNKVKLSLDSAVIDTDLTDFPVLINLDVASGKTNFDITQVFDELGVNSKKIAVEIGDTGVQCSVEIEHWGSTVVMFPTEHTATYVKATTTFNTSYYPHFATDPDKTLVGSWVDNAWVSDAAIHTNQKFNIEYSSAFVLRQILLENGHSSGTNTDNGIKNFIIYGTNSTTAFNNTDYSDLTDLTELGVFQAVEHTAVDESDPQYFDLPDNTLSFRYYVLRIADNFSLTDYMAIRHIELWASSLMNSVYPVAHNDTYVKATTFYSSSYQPHFATNPDRPLVGTWTDNAWLSIINVFTNQKFNIDYGSAIVLHRIILENGHHEGGFTERGIQNFIAYGTNSTTAFNNTDYSDLTDLTELGVFQAREHVSTNIADPQYFGLHDNLLSFRYYVFRIADSFSTADYMAIRRIRLVEYRKRARIHIKVPSVLAASGAILNLYYDSTQPNNTTYIGDTGSVAAQDVWDANFIAVYHMSQDPNGTAPQVLDSTTNGNHQTSYGTQTSVDLIDGLTGKAIDFDGSDDYLQRNQLGISGDITVELFANFDAMSTTSIPVSSYASALDSGYLLSFDATGHPSFAGRDNSGSYYNSGYTTQNYDDGSYHLFTGCLNASVWSINVDGGEDIVSFDSGSTGAIDEATYLVIGAHRDNTGSPDYHCSTMIQEIRFSNVARSDAWVKATNYSLTDSLISFSYSLYISVGNTFFSLQYNDAPVAITSILEAYHIGKIPVKFLEQYSLVEEKSITVPEGWNQYVRLRVDKNKVVSDITKTLSLVQLTSEHSALFDVVKSFDSGYTVPSNSYEIIWLDPNGDDVIGDGTENNPYKTLYHAVPIAMDLGQIRMKPGKYVETESAIRPQNWDLTITSSTGDWRDVVIEIRQDNDAWFNLNNYNYITFSNVTIHDYSEFSGTVFTAVNRSVSFTCVYYVYKGTNTSRQIGSQSQLNPGSIYITHSVIDMGVATAGVYFSGYARNSIILGVQAEVLGFINGSGSYNSIGPGLDTLYAGHGLLDSNVIDIDFVEDGSVEIAVTSGCVNTGSSSYRSWYEGSAPDIGIWEVGSYEERLKFVDSDGNNLRVEFVEFDAIAQKGTFYVEHDLNSTEDSFVFLYCSVVRMDDHVEYLYPTEVTASTFYKSGSVSSTYAYRNWRQRILQEVLSVSGNKIQLAMQYRSGYNFIILSCFIGHQGTVAPDFDGNQKRVTFNGGDHGVTVNASDLLSDVIDFDLDSTKTLFVSVYIASGSPSLGQDAGASYCAPYRTDEATDQSYQDTPIGDWAVPDWSRSIVRRIYIPSVIADMWVDYTSVLHGVIDDTGKALDSFKDTETTTSPVFDSNYQVDTPFGTGFDLSYSSLAHLITSGIFSITAGTIIVVFSTSNTLATQVLFATPASTTTNQHKFEITTAGAIQITDNGGTTSITTDTGFNDGEYHTVIISWDATGRIVEVDKVARTISNPTAIFTTPPSSVDSLIGYDYVLKDSAGDSFDGIISEFRVGDTAFDSTEVTIAGYSETDTLFDSTISSKIKVSENWGAGAVSTIKDIGWIIAKAVTPKFWDEPWFITHPPTLTVFEEYWGLKLLTTLTESYGDIAVSKNVIIEWYGDGSNPKNTFVEKYDDAKKRKAVYSLLWLINANPQAFISEKYAITESVVLNTINELYEIKERNKVLSSMQIPYYLLSEEGIVTEQIATVSVNGEIVNVLGFSISAGLDQYAISSTIQVAKESVYNKFMYMASVVIEYSNTTYNLVVESSEKKESNESVRYSVKLKSPTVKLDTPYANTITDSLPNGANSKALIIDMAAIEEITVDYSIDLPIWNIPSHAISINDDSPLQVIKRIANAIGAIVQTKPNGDLLIISKYPISPTMWDSTTPDISLSTDSDILDLNEVFVVKNGYNAFLISDQGSSSDSVRLEEENIDTNTKIIKAYQVPFNDSIPLILETSSPHITTIDRYQYPIVKDMPIVDTNNIINEIDNWEIVEFIDHSGSVSYPIYSIIDVDWIEDELTASISDFIISEDGTLTVVDPSGVPSESLLKIKYTTKYWEYKVTAQDINPVQVFVPEII